MDPIKPPVDPLAALKALKSAPPPETDPLEQLKAMKAQPLGAGVLGGAESLVQGVLGGFADEIGGAGAAALDAAGDVLHGRPTKFAQDYAMYRDTARNLNSQFAQAHPIGHAALETIGGAVPAALTGAASEAALGGRLGTTLAGQVASGAATGGVTAGIFGAGDANGSATARLVAGAKAAPLGAAFGAAIPVAGKLVGGIARQIPALARNTTGLGTKGEALRQLGEIANQSGMTADQIAAKAAADKAAGSPVILADALGDNGRNLVRWVGNQPAQAASDLRDVLESRQTGQYDRILSGVRDAMGRDYANMPQTDEGLLAARRANAEPAYAAAYAQPPVMTPTLEKALQDPDFQRAIAKGRALKAKADLANGITSSAAPTATQQVVTGTGKTDLLYAKLINLNGGDANKANEAMRALGYADADIPRHIVQGSADNNGPIPIDVLDYAKRYLDNGIRRGFDAQSTFDHTTASATNGILSKVLDEVDAAVPAYAKARALYHSDSKMMDALALGRKGLNMHPDELAAATSQMSPGELDLARAGFMDAFKQQAGSVADRNDLSKRFLTNEAMRKRFEAMAPSPTAMASMRDLGARETQMARTLNAMTGNSTTFAQAQMNAAINGGISPADIAMLPLSPHRSVLKLARGVGQELRNQSNIKLANQLGPMLQAEPGTQAFDDAIQALRNSGPKATPKVSAAQGRFLNAIAQAFAAQTGSAQRNP